MLNWYATREDAPWNIIVLLAILTFAAEVLGNESFPWQTVPNVSREECEDLCYDYVKSWSPRECVCQSPVEQK